MVNYAKGKIYKICDLLGDEELIYIGSTCGTLYDRFAIHKSYYKNRYRDSDLAVYKVFEKYGLNCCEIQLIEDYPCKSKQELFEREKYYISTLKCVNKARPIITAEERRIRKNENARKPKNVEHKKEYQKKYNQTERRKVANKLRNKLIRVKNQICKYKIKETELSIELKNIDLQDNEDKLKELENQIIKLKKSHEEEQNLLINNFKSEIEELINN
jgi:hypothetical protein